MCFFVTQCTVMPILLFHSSWLIPPVALPHLPQSPPQQPHQPPPPSIASGVLSPRSSNEKDNTDLFRCIWCRKTYPTMSLLSTHIKEAKHGEREAKREAVNNSGVGTSTDAKASNVNNTNADSKVSTPRKLVRGQDVWLGKGEEQTRQILKCMWCGQSFRSLADLTTHMSETKHYTKVIPQEQLSTWRNQSRPSPSNSSTPSPLSTPNNNLNGMVRTFYLQIANVNGIF